MSNDNLSFTEQYVCALTNSEPSNYTMIPNIIDHLTYDDIHEETGAVVTKRLSVYSAHLYRVLREIAGRENVSWRNTEHLAEISNMSVGQVTKCKKELQKNFHQLDGTPLISIKEKVKPIVKNGERLNGTTYHQITILNIWGFNRAFFLKKKFEKVTDSPHESVKVTDSPHESVIPGTDSLSERNKINNKTPLSNKQHSTAKAVSVCSLKKEVVSVDRTTEAFNWLMKIGCDELGAMSIMTNFTPQDLHLASGYVQTQIHKKGKIENVVGYLRKTLENKWWETKK